MNVLNNQDSYQTTSQYQQNAASNYSTQLTPNEQTGNASKMLNETTQQGVTRDSQRVAPLAQREANVENTTETNRAVSPVEAQAIQEAQKKNATNELATQSQRSQVSINIAQGDQNSANPVQERTAEAVNTLRNEQQQESVNRGYQTYQETLNTPVNNLARGLVG